MARFAAGVIVASMIGSGWARAEVESNLVKQGEDAYENLDFPRAVELLKQALDETLTREETIVARRTLAFSYAALDQVDEARDEFVQLLKIVPGFGLDRTVSPKVRSAFDEARRQLEARPPEEPPLPVVPVELAFEPPAPEEGQAVTVRAARAGAARIELFHRARGQKTFSRVVTAAGPGGQLELTVPGSEVLIAGLEVYASVLDQNGVEVGRSGTAAAPIAVAVRPRRPTVMRERWFWGFIAAGVVTVVVTIVGAGFGIAAAWKSKVVVVPH